MQTFIALLLSGKCQYISDLFNYFVRCALLLDYRRCGKQRVEAKQILSILEGTNKRKGWSNHPAVHMWRGFEDALKLYINAHIYVWVNHHGYKNNMETYHVTRAVIPPFLSNIHFVQRHQSNLIGKDPVFYGKYNWQVSVRVGYYWYQNEVYTLHRDGKSAVVDLSRSAVPRDEDLDFSSNNRTHDPNGCKYKFRRGKVKGLYCNKSITKHGYCRACLRKKCVKTELGLI